MNNRWIILAMLVGLTACQSSVTATSVPTSPATVTSPPPISSPRPTDTLTVTNTPQLTTQPADTSESQPGTGCTVVSPQPTPGPTEESMFPAVSEQDWVQGPDSAYITLLEYSDFQ